MFLVFSPNFIKMTVTVNKIGVSSEGKQGQILGTTTEDRLVFIKHLRSKFQDDLSIKIND